MLLFLASLASISWFLAIWNEREGNDITAVLFTVFAMSFTIPSVILLLTGKGW